MPFNTSDEDDRAAGFRTPAHPPKVRRALKRLRKNLPRDETTDDLWTVVRYFDPKPGETDD
jgi:hypothetical protein